MFYIFPDYLYIFMFLWQSQNHPLLFALWSLLRYKKLGLAVLSLYLLASEAAHAKRTKTPTTFLSR
jgi:hypothetical protein